MTPKLYRGTTIYGNVLKKNDSENLIEDEDNFSLHSDETLMEVAKLDEPIIGDWHGYNLPVKEKFKMILVEGYERSPQMIELISKRSENFNVIAAAFSRSNIMQTVFVFLDVKSQLAA